MPTPDRLRNRLPKPLLVLLLGALVLAALVPGTATASSAVAVPAQGLRLGTSGPAVRHVQRMLARLGYAVKPDGQFGPHTASIVRIFRREVGLPRVAKVTPRFVRMLHRAQNGGRGDLRWLGIRRLSLGARGHDVRVLQRDLTKLGFAATSDGQFGPLTRLSVRSFERAAGLRITGVITPKVARTLKEVAKAGHEAGAVSKTTAQPPVATAPTQTPAQPTGQLTTAPPVAATIVNGLAVAPPGAPAAVVEIIQAGNAIATMPYRYGGGHDTWQDTAYDCSGSVSYALHGASLLQTPMSSYDFPGWGEAGPGQWVTVYGSESHAYMVVAGLRFDTSASKDGGSRWTTEMRSPAGYVARHPAGL